MLIAIRVDDSRDAGHQAVGLYRVCLTPDEGDQMADGKNEKFIADPLAFIREIAIDSTLFDASISGRPRFMPRIDEDTWFSMFKAACSKFRKVAFDLVPRSHGSWFVNKREFCVLRFDRSNFEQDFVDLIKEHRAQKSEDTVKVLNAEYERRGADPERPEYQRWINARKALDTFQDRYDSRLEKFTSSNMPIRGYFFPYLSPVGPQEVNNLQWGVKDMGWVDVPRQNPNYQFVFTGMMNGCALSITNSPLGDDYFRIYHYPNVGTYPNFKAQLLWDGQWRNKIWCVEEYGAPDAPDAFNFLHYHDGEWYLYCQPQTQNHIREGVVMSIRAKTVRGVQLPGRIRIADLQNAFPQNYL